MRKIAWLPVFLVLFILLQGSLISTSVTASTNHEDISVDQTSVGTVASINATGQDIIKETDRKFEVVQIGDHEVSDIWEDITPVPIDTFGTTGSISSIYGEDWIYFYITHDVGLEWIALQWDSDGSATPGDNIDQMADGDDMWIFGETEQSGIIGDAKSMGLGGGSAGLGVDADSQDDLFWERILVNDTEGTTTHIGWEVKRLKTTVDTSGYDQVFSTQANTTIRFASDANHKGDNNIAKFALSSIKLGGDITVIPPENGGGSQEGQGGDFIRTHILWGLGIGILTSAFVFVPSYLILNKKEVTT